MSAPTPYVLAENATSASSFQIGLSGPALVNVSNTTLKIQNAAQSADVALESLTLALSATSANIVLNSSATGSGSSWTTTLQPAQSGQTAALTFTLPSNAGTSGQVLSTDGSGNLSFISAASTAACAQYITHTVNYSDTSPDTFFTLPANAVVLSTSVNVVTAFNGTSPSLSIGVSGTTSKFMSSTQSNLATVGGYASTVSRYVATSGSSQTVLITFAAGSGATAGQAIVQVAYTVPTAA